MFNIFANDFPSIRNCQTCLDLSADDTVIMITGASEFMEDLNSYLDQLGKWMINWKIKVNTGKCQTVYFSKRRTSPDPLKLYHRAIKFSNEVSGGYPRQRNDF
ncbi:hypothetical protein AVEN_29257-1 [Araneus ventricosus]|uniref:Uncharacterized protein n=1 Tax=Araneus ventricosus TaxID=182803 RepID=A0A4Y2IQ51_ARAVE|nr:hypothetical protein AVEN_29257-1 [Araneus ventricosus]